METRTSDFGALRFHCAVGLFPLRFLVRRGRRGFRFPLVSCRFPPVSRFVPYIRETGNEASFLTSDLPRLHFQIR